MKKKIIEVLNEVNEEIGSYEGNDMISDLGIDSHDIFNIVVGLEEKFEIEISPLLLKTENFASLEAIEQMIRDIIEESR